MTTVTIHPRPLSGRVTPPPSKSCAHRALIAAALGAGVSTIDNVALSQDIQATLNCLRALGTGVVEKGDTLELHGLGNSIPQAGPFPILDCGESGSTLRFFMPIALVVSGGAAVQFTGRGRLMQRPQEPYFRLFEQKDVTYERAGDLLTLRGRLTPGDYPLPGNVSSQFFTGLLFALSLLDGPSTLRSTTPLESAEYIDMTLDALEPAGVRVEKGSDGLTYHITPGTYQPFRTAVEADWSQAAFWYAALFAGCRLDIEGLNPYSTQGDMRIVPYFLKLQGEGLVELDVSGCPDLVPPLAAMAIMRRGETRIVNAARLRFKESDRLSSVTAALSALGADIEEHPDSLTIRGRATLPGGVSVDCCNDHRIAMMTAVAAIRCEQPVTLVGAECVNKSYPNFWEHYEQLGGKLDVVVSG